MNDKEEYKLVFEHFKSMEQRYHTWMNYYSLFNGALLVAYCSILVSMGEISFDASDIKLNCTYWDFLVLIALLGLWASLCWRLSIKGHNSWLNSWRLALRSYGYEFDSHIYLREKDYTYQGKKNDKEKDVLCINPPFYSTAKVTTSFIGGVIFAWLFALVYAWIKYLDDIDIKSWNWVCPCEWDLWSWDWRCAEFDSFVAVFVVGFIYFLSKNFYSDLSDMFASNQSDKEIKILSYNNTLLINYQIVSKSITYIKRCL